MLEEKREKRWCGAEREESAVEACRGGGVGGGGLFVVEACRSGVVCR